VSSRRRTFDVAIVGGGVIGLAVAWRAAARGLRVALLERGQPGGETSSVAAGMIAPISEASPSEPALLALGRASAAAYPPFVEELQELTGIDPLYRRFGTVYAARDADEAEALERELEFRQGLGLAVARLRASEARALEPALAPTLRLALEIPDDHALDPRALCTALAAAARARGVTLRAGAEVGELAVSPAPGGDARLAGVRLAGGELVGAGQVVVAAGPWSAGLTGLPDAARVPLRPVKGQILRLHDPTGPGLLRRVLRMQPGYLVPRGDGRYVLGATMEERGFDTTATAGAVFELLRDAIELVPGVAELVLDEVNVGIRPGTPDNAPLIGPGALPGLVWATGHHRHGILQAPATAELVAGLLAGEPLPELAAPFAPARFAPSVQAAA
jgi:glycine oxidase